MQTAIVPAPNRILIKEVPKEHPMFDSIRPKANLVLPESSEETIAQSKVWLILAVGKTIQEMGTYKVGDYVLKANFESGGVIWHEKEQYILIEPSHIIGTVLWTPSIQEVN